MGNPHLGRHRVVASDSDSSDADNDSPRPTQEERRNQREMARIAMQDLGSHTRHQMTSTDTGPRQPFVSNRRLEVMRRANNEDTEEYQMANNNQESTTSWNTFQLVAPRDHEELPDINGGNSHRSNMMANIAEERAQMGGKTDWDALDQGNRRGGSSRGGRGRGGGRGGGVVGTRGRARTSPMKVDRPLDPAVDPNRSYGYKNKGKPITANYPANALGGPVRPTPTGGYSNTLQGHAFSGVSSRSLKSTAKAKAMPPPLPSNASTARHHLPAWFGELAQNETAEDVVVAQQKSMLSSATSAKSGPSTTASPQNLSPLIVAKSTKSMSPTPAPTLTASNIQTTSNVKASPLGSPSAFLAYVKMGNFNKKAYGQPAPRVPVATPITASNAQPVLKKATDTAEIRRVPVSEVRLAPPEDTTAFTDGGPSPASLGSGFTASATSMSTSGPSPFISAIAPIPALIGLGISTNEFDEPIAKPPSPEPRSRIALADALKEANASESASQSTAIDSTKKAPMFIEVNGRKYVLANAIPADNLPPSESPQKVSDPPTEESNLLLDNGYALGESLLDTSIPKAEVSKTNMSPSRPAEKRKSTIQESRSAKGKSPPNTSRSAGFGADKRTVNPFGTYGPAPPATKGFLPLQPVSGNVPNNSPSKGGSIVGDSNLFPRPSKPDNPFSTKNPFGSGDKSPFKHSPTFDSPFSFKPSTQVSDHKNGRRSESPRKGIKRTNAGPGYDWIMADIEKAARLRGGQGAGTVQLDASRVKPEPRSEPKTLFAYEEKDQEKDDEKKGGESDESSEL